MILKLASPKAKLLFLAISALVLGILFVGAGLARPSAGRSASGDSPHAFDVALADSRKVTGFVESYGQRVAETERELARKDSELRGLKSEVEKYGKAMEQVLGELESLRAREAQSQAARPSTPGDPASLLGISRDVASAPPLPTPALPRIEKITLPEARKAAEQAARKDEVRLPAGSFAEATLLTGVYAPTSGSAQPVAIKVDLTFVGPNQSRIPIQGAFLIGKAVGDPNAARAVIQLERLSFVREGGKTVELPVNGYVADQDGVMGLKGIYDWRIHEAAALATVTGGVAAAADAAAAKETVNQINPLGGATQLVTGNLGRYAAAKGASGAAGEIEKIISKRIDELVPEIYVENGRKLTLVLLEGVTLSGLPLSELRTSTSRSPYAGLDLDR